MAAVYYKFSVEKDFRSILIEGHYITVGDLKDKISNAKELRKWKDDLAIRNAVNNEEYDDEAILIPKFTSVVIRRVPRCRPKTIVVANKHEQVENIQKIDSEATFSEAGQSVMDDVNDFDNFDFGDEVFAIPKVSPLISSNPVNIISKADDDEDNNIQALVNTSPLDHCQIFDGIGRSSGFGRGCGRGNPEQLKPPQGYVCHRCKIPGHFIQHCPTNGDPNFDIKKFNRVLNSNVSAIRNKVKGFPDSRSAGNLPPELYCLLCERVMKDAVFSKCCFQSFCENCIRDQVMSKSNCVCGAKGRPANDFVPNNAVRDTIKRILETNYSSAGNPDQALKGGKAPLQNVETTKIRGVRKEDEPLISEQGVSDITNEPALQGSASLPADKEVQHKEVTVDASKEFALPAASAPLQNVEARKIQEDKKLDESLISQPEVSEITKEPTLQGSVLTVDEELNHKEVTKIRDSKLSEESSIFQPEALGVTKEPALQGSGALAANKVQRKEVTVEKEKKKSKRKSNLPINAAENEWTSQQYYGAQSYMQQPIYPFSYNPYWNSMHPGMEAYMKQWGPHMGYDLMPSNIPFGAPGMTPSQISPDRRESSKNQECHSKSVDVTSAKKLKRASNMILSPSSRDMQPRQERKEQSASKRKTSQHGNEYDDSYHQHKHHKQLDHRHETPFREYDSSDDEERHFKRRRSYRL